MGACIHGGSHQPTAFRRGKQLTVNGQSYSELKELAEGGYGYILRVEHTNSKKHYALKKMILQSKEAEDVFNNEAQILEKLKNSKNVIRMVDQSVQCKGKQRVGLIVMELAKMTLLDLLKTLPAGTVLPVEESIRILLEVLQGIQEMHQLGIAHRDLKAENILLMADGIVKLCDFGSSSSQVIECSACTAAALQRYEEEFDRTTTLIYRPPEMIDTRRGWSIGAKVDVWMFGCVAFMLAFGRHPFQEQGKLAIVNASYSLQPSEVKDSPLAPIVKATLVPNPSLRPTAQELLKTLHSLQASIGKKDGSEWGDYS